MGGRNTRIACQNIPHFTPTTLLLLPKPYPAILRYLQHGLRIHKGVHKEVLYEGYLLQRLRYFVYALKSSLPHLLDPIPTHLRLSVAVDFFEWFLGLLFGGGSRVGLLLVREEDLGVYLTPLHPNPLLIIHLIPITSLLSLCQIAAVPSRIVFV